MKNKFKLSLLFATAIAVLKVNHDRGGSKFLFILAMIFTISSLSALNYWLIAAFLAPLLFYVIDTGNLHQANLRSEPKPFKSYWILDKPIDKLATYLAELPDIYPTIRNMKHDIEYYQARGFLSCLLVSFVFTLPFLFANYLYGLPLLFWPFCVRYITWGIKQPDGTKGSEWWWVCTFILFFSYSLLFFMSL
jgi:hypothetical protein